MSPPDIKTSICRSRALFKKRSSFRCEESEHQRLFDAAADFASELNHGEPRWLVMLGPSGIGKTHLAREIFRHFMDHSRFITKIDERWRLVGNTGQFCDWRQFCGDLRGGSYGRIDDLEGESLVILDDIGSEYDPNGFIASALDRIINSRSATGRVKWTVITCNMLLEQIAERIDTRIADRMLRNGSVVVETQLESWELTKRAAGMRTTV